MKPTTGSLPLFGLATTETTGELTKFLGYLVPDEPIEQLMPCSVDQSSYNLVLGGRVRLTFVETFNIA
uniref:Uncharacterized protein n=1 Tax=Romanomermis culicivorax TaxID=13658 RepID=A0A915J877_ROMCU